MSFILFQACHPLYLTNALPNVCELFSSGCSLFAVFCTSCLSQFFVHLFFVLWFGGLNFSRLIKKANGTPLQYSCPETPTDRGAWWALVHGVTTEWFHFHFSLSCIVEGNGSPLQCSCLENPRDGGAWWAAVYGVSQSWTRLKWRSSSSSNVY